MAMELSSVGVRTGVMAAAAVAASVSAQSITVLGVLQAGHHYAGAAAVSADGSSVVVNSGVQFFQGTRSYRWRQGGEMLDIGAAPDAVNTFAQAINADGTAMAGSYYTADRDRAFRWTTGGGIQDLGTLAGATYGASAWGISLDGSVVSGTSSSTNGDRAYRWTEAGGMQDLGVLAGGGYSFGLGLSGDGSAVTGLSESATGERAFVWTSGGGMQELIGGDGEPSAGFAISRNGSVVAGYCGMFAARWQDGAFQSLGSLEGGTFSTAYCVSGDGLSAGGFSDDASGELSATLWTASLGMVDLNVYLASLGVDMAGWRLTTTTGISADGRTLVGVGVFDGEERGWVATIPAPGTAGVLGLAGLLASRRRRR